MKNPILLKYLYAAIKRLVSPITISLGLIAIVGGCSIATIPSEEVDPPTISEFKITSPVDSVGDITDDSIEVYVPYSTDISNVMVEISIPDGMIVDPDTGTSHDFTGGAIVFTVTNEENDTKSYTATIVSPPTATSISSFAITSPVAANGIIDDANSQVAIEVPFGTDTSAMTVDITQPDGITVSPSSGTTQDFTNAVLFTVTNNLGDTRSYTVTVGFLPTETSISYFAITGPVAANGTIDDDNSRVEMEVPFGTDTSAMTVDITVADGSSVSPSSGTTQDFTNAVLFTVTNNKGDTRSYTVTVGFLPTDNSISSFSITSPVAANGTIDDDNSRIEMEVPFGTDTSAMTVDITVPAGSSVSPSSGTTQNFTNEAIFIVTNNKGDTRSYTVRVGFLPTETSISSFSITSPVSVNGTIDDGSSQVAIEVPFGTDTSAMTVDITVPAGSSVSPNSGTTQDFTNAAVFTVTNNKGDTRSYTASVTVLPDATIAAEITSFSISNPIFSEGTVDNGAERVHIDADFSADTSIVQSTISALTVSIEVPDGVEVSPASGTVHDFTQDLTFTVTGSDMQGNPDTANAKDYVVSLTPVATFDGVSYILVYNEEGLQNINTDRDKNYYLANDITITSTSWNTIDYFTGLLDGGTHTISGLNLSTPSTDHVGLFSRIGNRVGQSSSTTVRNLTIEDPIVTGNDYVGALAGTLESANVLIENVYVTGATISGTRRVGGLVGSASTDTEVSIIRDSSVRNSTITSTGIAYTVGGFIGEARGIIERCYVDNVSVRGLSVVGGFSGTMSTGEVRQSYATNVEVIGISGSSKIGGFTGTVFSGLTSNPGTLSEDNYVTGSVNSSGDAVGGFAGDLNLSNTSSHKMTIRRNYAQVTVSSGGSDHGMFVGYREATSSSGSISSQNNYYKPLGVVSAAVGDGSATGISALSTPTAQSDFANWDFGSVWHFPGASQWPTLQWQNP